MKTTLLLLALYSAGALHVSTTRRLVNDLDRKTTIVCIYKREPTS